MVEIIDYDYMITGYYHCSTPR